MVRMLLALSLMLSSLTLWAAKNDRRTAIFDHWNQLSSRVLANKAYQFLGQDDKHDSALVCYSIIVNRYYEGRRSKDDVKLAINAMHNLGVMHMTYYYDYRKSYEYLLQAQQLAQNDTSVRELPAIYLALANVMHMGHGGGDMQQESTRWLRRAFDTAVRRADSVTCCSVLTSLMEDAIVRDTVVDVASELARFSLLGGASPSPMRRCVDFIHRAMQAGGRGDYVEAARLMMQAKDCRSGQLLSARHEAGCLLNAGRLFCRGRDYAQSEQVLQQALLLARQHDCREYVRSAYGELCNLHEEQGLKQQADHYELLYWRCKDSLDTEGHLGLVESTKFRFELNLANEAVRQLSERQRLKNMMLMGAAVVIVIIGILLYRLLRAYRRVRLAHYHLYLRNVEMLHCDEVNRRQNEALRQQNQLLSTENDNLRSQMEAAQKTDKPRYQASRMEEEDEALVMQRVIDVLQHSDEVFNQGFTINRMAELVHRNYRYVSQAVNNTTGNNFSALLNEYRIREACRRLNDQEHYGNMTIEAIAESVGYKSRTNFAAVFKKATGLSPSEYQRMARLH
ncbi:MAG: helix-turn-helix transcriptional regulator [Prevotella sp.]|nr:helix-turn-helix transcriptional regulator [Prevotella sp.]